ncbi:MAG: polyamine aminopropyltransferase [Clostridia bacterium]
MADNVWFTELQTNDVTLGLRIKAVLHRETTAFQQLLVLDTDAYGRVLVLDGAIQTTERDEFVYHEMMAHVPLTLHPHPRRVGIIGGGDGGVLREVVKHPEVEEAHLIEIDERVIEASRAYFPGLAVAFEHPRSHVHVTDGIKFIREAPEPFDVIIIDSTDPVGPAEGLFGEAFYQSVFRALGDDGIVVAQSESPLLEPELIQTVQRGLRSAFPVVTLYLGAVATYPTGLWTFSLGSKKPLLAPRAVGELNTRYWTPAVQDAAFVLPPMVRELLG